MKEKYWEMKEMKEIGGNEQEKQKTSQSHGHVMINAIDNGHVYDDRMIVIDMTME